MHKSYNILLKKSILGPVLALCLFWAVPALGIAPGDPQYALQAPVYKQINLPEAWNYTTGSPDIVVAVLDTGVDISHPDLAENIWVNPNEIPANGIDDDYNGYIDDVNGWNFVENDNNVSGVVEETFFGSEPISHGTVIAGLIGARGDNNINGTGVNWRVKIMPVRTIDNYGSGVYDSIAKAIDYAGNNGADIISLSFVGYSDEAVLYEALRRAYAKNILIVVAAGNNRADGTGYLEKNVLYPVCYKEYANENWLLGVTSVDKSDRLSVFANFGSCIDITAPGENIYSTARRTGDVKSVDFVGPWAGTSFATPLVAGAAALIKSIQPDWSVSKLIQTILSSTDDTDKMNPQLFGELGYGRLNVGEAVRKAVAEKELTGNFSNICYPAETYIYCHSLLNNKSTVIANLRSRILAFDGSDRETAVAFVKESGKYMLKAVSRTGQVELSQALEAGVDYNFVRLAAVGKEKIIYVSGYNKTLNKTKIISYSLLGARKSSHSQAGKIDTFDVDRNGNIFIAAIRKGKLMIDKYSRLGKLDKSIDLGVATGADDLKVGNIYGNGSEQITVIARRGVQTRKYIIDGQGYGIYSDRLADTKEKWNLIVQDYDNNGIFDVLAYNRSGGVFGIVTGKGVELKSILIPRLK